MANTVFHSRTSLSANGAMDLNFIDGNSITDGDYAFVDSGDGLYIYRMNASSGATQNVPYVVSPSSNASNKRWILEHDEQPGVIKIHSGSTAPTGYLLCDGTSYSRSAPYDQLFAIIGTTYGYADGSHFNVPDMRGRTPVGVGTGVGNGSSGTGLPSGTALTAIARGTWKGEETHVIVTAEMANHTHPITDPGHSHTFWTNASGGSGATKNSGSSIIPSEYQTASSTTGVVVGNTGSGTGHNNIQPVVGVNFIIKY